MSCSKEKREFTTTIFVPTSFTCDVCGCVHTVSDDDLLYFEDGNSSFGTLIYEHDAGQGTKTEELHFCSVKCMLSLLFRVPYSCHIRFSSGQPLHDIHEFIKSLN